MLGAMKIPWPTRRWFQFSLRALLVFVTLSAIPCSWLAVKLREAKREEAAAAAFEKAGGYVVWDEKCAGTGVASRRLGRTFLCACCRSGVLWGDEVKDGTLVHLDATNHLQGLVLSTPNVTDAVLEHLQGLRELKKLGLYPTQVTDAGLEKIARFKQLETLALRGTQFTDAGLRKLAGLSKLQTLLLVDTNSTDAVLEHLQRMKQLNYVYLDRTRATAEGVKKLRQALPTCEVINQP